MKYLELAETDSTNSYISRSHADLESMTMVYALRQTSGRGQKGNSWESEPGKNLTFSVYMRPALPFKANRQFAISEAVALAVADALKGFGIEAKVKWPNDIYVGDKKICGILIEHALMGSEVSHTIIGAGINVNQERFVSDAPNPVSMKNLTGEEYALEEVRGKVGECLEEALGCIYTEEGRRGLHERFLAALWRGDGRGYPFYDVEKQERYMGVIRDVEPTGYLKISDEMGNLRRYAFKEVAFLLD